jgi:calmodulin
MAPSKFMTLPRFAALLVEYQIWPINSLMRKSLVRNIHLTERSLQISSPRLTRYPCNIVGFKENFTLFDKDGTGHIDQSELGTVMRSLGKNPTEAEISEMLSLLDGDGSGNIDFTEFLHLMAKDRQEAKTAQAIAEAFTMFDKDQNGLVSAKELSRILTSLGEKMTIEEATECINDVDVDGDGNVNYEDFITMMMQPLPKWRPLNIN